ncbi:MAG TPA: hypothetical protein VKT18_08960, partial [Acidimicrobiales bacterium]|nr:hypothetical protein [Acidimicrobiales bacterium]
MVVDAQATEVAPATFAPPSRVVLGRARLWPHVPALAVTRNAVLSSAEAAAVPTVLHVDDDGHATDAASSKPPRERALAITLASCHVPPDSSAPKA